MERGCLQEDGGDHALEIHEGVERHDVQLLGGNGAVEPLMHDAVRELMYLHLRFMKPLTLLCTMPYAS